MPENNEVLAAEAAEVTDVTTTETTTDVVVPEADAGHKVLFYVIIGALCLTGIGIPFAIWKYRKMRKQLKAYEDKYGPLPEETETAADAAETSAEATAPAETK